MNRSILGLIVKFIATFVAAWIAYGVIEDNPFLWIVIVAIAVAAINYLIGDMLVLPRFGNIVAAVGDGVMAALIAYLIDLITNDFYTTFTSNIVFLVIIIICEYFIHKLIVHDERVE